MRCAWDTLKTFSLNDPKLAGTPGALAVLHTHNRQLGFHPHVHVCLPGAAFASKDRLWRTKVKLGRAQGGKAAGSREPTRGGYLFNHKALAKVFAAAYFSPSWTAFQADGGRDFSVIVDGVSV